VAPPQSNSHGDVLLLHNPLPIFFAISGVAPTLGDNMNIIQKQLDPLNI
jgi:hypothetical protein